MPTPATFLLPLNQLPDPLPIPVLERPFDVSIRPPGSKSITNRALLLAALADGTSTLRGALVDADDAQVMIEALRKLGAVIEIDGTTLRVKGVAGRWKIAPGQTVHLNLHNAGTATRFLAAAALLAPAGTSVVIDGDARMRERPIGELADLLRSIGVAVAYRGAEGLPPIEIKGCDNLEALEPRHRLGITASSQFISAVILIAPFLPRGLFLTLAAPVTSRPYINMSAKLLGDALKRPLGWIRFESNTESLKVRVPSLGEPLTPPVPRSSEDCWAPRPNVPMPAFEVSIEPDASGATYFQAAAGLCPGSSITIAGLDPLNSGQGDAYFCELLLAGGMGMLGELVNNGGGRTARITGPPRLNPIDVNLSDMPDTAMTAAVLACFAWPAPGNPTATTTLRGLRTLRVKETDRLAALQTELTKLGAVVEIFKDGDDEGLRITPPQLEPAPSARAPMPRIEFDTYNDHRMAMALALVGLRVPGVHIRNPACVAKTYPTFWRDFAKLYEPSTPSSMP